MVATASKPPAIDTPHSDLVGFLIKRHYADIGCDLWDTRRVQRLCAKFGDTPVVMATRMRLSRSEFERRMETNVWTKQDGLILTILEREIDFIKGGVAPEKLTPEVGT